MFTNTRFAYPQKRSLLGTLVAATVAFIGVQSSAFVGFLAAIFTLLMIIVASFMEGSIWPTKRKKENWIIFSLFWGLMIGVLLPFLVKKYLGGGVEAMLEVLKG